VKNNEDKPTDICFYPHTYTFNLKNKEKALPKPLNSNALSLTIATLIIGRFWFCEVSVGYGVYVININVHLIQRCASLSKKLSLCLLAQTSPDNTDANPKY
jgi:hypothetical protein